MSELTGPHVTTDNEDDEVSFEWWGPNGRKLTVYVNRSGQASYIKVWGPNMETDMESGNASGIYTCLKVLLAWVAGKPTPANDGPPAGFEPMGTYCPERHHHHAKDGQSYWGPGASCCVSDAPACAVSPPE